MTNVSIVPIVPLFDNIVGIKVEKKTSKYQADILIMHGESNNAGLVEVVAVGEHVTEVAVGDIVFIPLTAIRVPYEGKEYAICSQRHVYAKIKTSLPQL